MHVIDNGKSDGKENSIYLYDVGRWHGVKSSLIMPTVKGVLTAAE